MILPLTLPQNSYDIVIERGCLQKAGTLLNLNRKVLIVTDTGVPAQYAKTIADLSKDPVVVTLPMGESTKCFSYFEQLCRTLLNNSFTRTDCVVAVGGGVMGDLAGFVAASFMRGIDFYNIPTTLLSQVDSSIGGKVAIDLDDVKNIIGAFYQPKKVLIDPDVLSTLPKRHIAAGLAEAIKMAVCFDEKLFTQIEACENPLDMLEDIIIGSLKIKRMVVEQDEKEAGLRKALNFGHTLGHAVETLSRDLFHGECVALGMLPMCTQAIRQRLIPILKRIDLPTTFPALSMDDILSVAGHDKKADGREVSITFVDTVGQCQFIKIPVSDLKHYVEGVL
ncbi:MAG: 3-dehydroquinate synthase [Clostridia bacterium]|nr:3-dehydroquinate synthase [Clostridia bacterium]